MWKTLVTQSGLKNNSSEQCPGTTIYRPWYGQGLFTQHSSLLLDTNPGEWKIS